MLKISKLADYAMVIMGHLAQYYGVKQSASQIAAANQLGLPTVTKVLKLLNDAGLLQAERGTHGGYQLASAAEDINIVAIVSAVDGSAAITECCKPEIKCDRSADCGMRPNWQIINQRVQTVLANISLADMLQPLPQHVALSTLNQPVEKS